MNVPGSFYLWALLSSGRHGILTPDRKEGKGKGHSTKGGRQLSHLSLEAVQEVTFSDFRIHLSGQKWITLSPLAVRECGNLDI